MAIEKKNINIPISGGVNQNEDSYLLKPPYLDVINGWYDKEGSIRKRGAYQALQTGLSPSATPFVFGETLHVLDRSSLTKFIDPSAIPSTVALDAFTSAIPVDVDDVPLSSDGAVEVVAAGNGSGRVVVAWTQPVTPEPDATVLSKVTNLYIAEYNEADLGSPTAGPFKIFSGPSPVDIEEISLTYGGGFWTLSGLSRANGALQAAVFQTVTQNLVFSVISAGCNHYDVYTDAVTGASWWLFQELNDTSNATPALRTWGDTVGIAGAIVLSTLSLGTPVTLGSVGVSDNYVGDKMLSVHIKGSTIWCAVASTRHENIYVYTTDLSWGSKSAATLVHTSLDDEPDWTGGWFDFATALGLSTGSPYYTPDNYLTSYISTNDRLGRMAICTNESGTGVYVFWTAPVLSDWLTTRQHFLPGLDTTGAGKVTVTSSFGVCWKNVSDALVVSSSLGTAPCSYLHSKPVMRDGAVYLGLSMSLETQLDLPYCFYNSATLSDANNVWPGEAPFPPLNDISYPYLALREASWKMGQLCALDGDLAVPVAQWGADLLAGPVWGLFDRSKVGTKGVNELPVMSTRRPVEMANTSSGWVIPGLYVVRNDHVIYERLGDGSQRKEEIEGRRLKAVLAHAQYAQGTRSSITVVGEEAYLSNGWLGVYDGSVFREASPNFIPPAVAPVSVTDSTSNNSFFQKDATAYVSWMVTDHRNRISRSSVSLPTTLSRTDGGSPPVREYKFKVYDQPPSLTRRGGRSRFETWFDGWRLTQTDVTRHAIYDPSRFSLSGPFRFTVDVFLDNGYGDVPLPGGTSELLPEPVGGCVYVTSSANRVWYIEPEDTGRVRFSKDFSVLGRVEFNRNLYLDIPDGSKPVAITTLDEQVVIFTDKSIYLVTGNLPNNSGGGANFYLQRVAFESGCSNRYSVFSTRHGVFFESERGLNLLTRGYEVLFAGEAIEDSVSGGSSITGTAYLPAYDLYLFTTSTDIMALQVGDGFRWTRWDFEHDQDIVASCAWGDYHVILGSEGSLFYMDMDIVTDVLMTLTTPWIYFGELEGFQRIRNVSLVGRNDTVSPTGYAAVQIGYDFAPSYTETLYYEYGVDITGDPMRIRLKPARGKCSSFRLRFAETAETTGQSVTNDAAITIAGISVEAGIKMLGIKNPRNPTGTPS